MPQLPGATVLSWAAPAWREDGSCVMASGEEAVGGRSVSPPAREQPGAGVNLAAPRGHFSSSDSAGLCSSLVSLPAPSSSSSSGQLLCASHGERTACPKPCCWKPLLQSREAPGSLFAQGESNKGGKNMEKAQNKAIWGASTPKFSEVLLASSFELKETAV